MEQRALRLGDIVDDYCPRERRITNHAIVALVGEAIQQTRCTTCEAEHAYKHAKVPRRKKPDEVEALTEQVLADLGGGTLVVPKAPTGQPSADAEPAGALGAAGANGASDEKAPAAEPAGPDEPAADQPPGDDVWPGHRRLIRASLPKSDTEPPPPRPIPEFTMHQRPFRGGQPFRYGQPGHGGNGPQRNGFRHGRSGNGPDAGQGHPAGGRPRGRSGRHRGGNKRSR
jgi:hypothetical protein